MERTLTKERVMKQVKIKCFNCGKIDTAEKFKCLTTPTTDSDDKLEDEPQMIDVEWKCTCGSLAYKVLREEV
jgi:hypothetical protein|tara:strand:+ start:561 stop:776 length:216 start_codon:yes stop_codon:yes gene_type:complete